MNASASILHFQKLNQNNLCFNQIKVILAFQKRCVVSLWLGKRLKGYWILVKLLESRKRCGASLWLGKRLKG
jgi:hypothetical protein